MGPFNTHFKEYLEPHFTDQKDVDDVIEEESKAGKNNGNAMSSCRPGFRVCNCLSWSVSVCTVYCTVYTYQEQRKNHTREGYVSPPCFYMFACMIFFSRIWVCLDYVLLY